MGNRAKQIAQAKESSTTEQEYLSKLVTMLITANDFTNEQLVAIAGKTKAADEKSKKLVTAVKHFVAALDDPTQIKDREGEFFAELKGILGEQKTVEIANAIELKEPRWLEKLKADTSTIEEKLDLVAKAIREKEITSKVEVTNDVRIAEPKWYKPFDGDSFLAKATIAFRTGLRDILKGVIFKVTSETPLRVVLTNSAGKAIDMKSIGGSQAVYSSGGGGGGGYPVNTGIKDASDNLINPATEEGQTTIADLLTEQSIPSGAAAAGQRDLLAANTWYGVPSTIPTSDYLLTATLETMTGTIRWSPANTGTPGTTNGHKADGTIVKRMKANTALYFASDVAGDDVNWTTEII